MTNEEALEAKRIIHWWISKKNSRIQAVQKLGGRSDVVNEVIANLLRYPPKTQMRFTTQVVHMTHWTICRLVYKDVRRIDSINDIVDPKRRQSVEQCDRWRWQQNMEQRDVDQFFWHIFMDVCEGNEKLMRAGRCCFRLLHGETLEQIAVTYGVSRERIRQICVNHIRRVQCHAERLWDALGQK